MDSNKFSSRTKFFKDLLNSLFYYFKELKAKLYKTIPTSLSVGLKVNNYIFASSLFIYYLVSELSMSPSAYRILMERKKTQIQKTMRLFLWSLFLVLLLTLAFAWWRYPEPFHFFREFISQLGCFLSKNGFDNSTSMLIMSVGFGLVALLSLFEGILYFLMPLLSFNIAKGFLYLLLSLGAAGIAVPGDHPSFYAHRVGSFLFIFSFAMVNFVSQMLRFIRKHWTPPPKRRFDFYLDLIVVILVFAVMIVSVIAYIVDIVFSVSLIALSAELWQKVILLVDAVAVIFIDVDDM